MPTLEALVHDMAGLIEPVGDPPLDGTISAVHVSGNCSTPRPTSTVASSCSRPAWLFRC